MSQPNSKKTMAQALEMYFGSFSEALNCIKIGKIENVNFTNQTVDVQILHKRVNMNLNKRELKDYALLKQVPFIVLGGGSSNLTFPIAKGDNCLLLFCDYEIDRWWDTGENLPANFERKHDISDAFAIVGVHSMVDLLKGYSQYVRLTYSDSSYVEIGESVDIHNEQTNVSGKLDVTGDITGSAKATAELHDNRQISGTFTTVDNKTITVADGVITAITKQE